MLGDAESIIQERLAQLQTISDRRNELLREMFFLIRSRKNVEQVLNLEETDDTDLHVWLANFDLSKHPETGFSTHESHSLLFSNALSTTSPSSTSQVVSTTKDIAHDIIVETRPSAPPLSSQESEDELDLLSTRRSRSHSKQSPPGPDEERAPTADLPSENRPSGTLKAEIDVAGHQNTREDVEMNDVSTASQPEVAISTIEDLAQDEIPGVDTQDADKKSDEQPIDDGDILTDVNSLDQLADQVDPPAPSEHTSEPRTITMTSMMYTSDNAENAIPITLPVAPLSSFDYYDFVDLDLKKEEPALVALPPAQFHLKFLPEYTLPPIKSLPIEFQRKGKPAKLQRKKEKEKADGKSKDKDDWVPLGVIRWNVTMKRNSVHKRVRTAMKCLTTREWTVALTEVKLIRALDRIESLQDNARWSFRQPKKQKGQLLTPKSHWDYLLEEAKWMRTDFREERKWKMAVAYNLSTAVLEWHAAESPQARIDNGICVMWKPPRESNTPPPDDDVVMGDLEGMDLESDHRKSSVMPTGDEEDEDEEEDDQDKQSNMDTQETAALIQESIEALEQHKADESSEFQPKTEEIDDSSALLPVETMNIDSMPVSTETPAPEEPQATSFDLALKTTSDNPVLGDVSGLPTLPDSLNYPIPTDPTNSASLKKAKSFKINLYAPLRERIAVADVDKTFITLDDFKFFQEDAPSSILPPADLTTIFPDVQPFGFLDPPPENPLPVDKKKAEKRSDKDDIHKRSDDFLQTRVWPVGPFMSTKPVLLGALQPSIHWKDNAWTGWEENPIVAEDGLPLTLPDGSFCDLFEQKSTLPGPRLIKEKEAQREKVQREREKGYGPDHLWSEADDLLLKSFVDRYPNNWKLIAECFNGSRLTISTDYRSELHCYDRWKEKWAPSPKHDLGPNGTPPPPPPPQMTTRGTKRANSTMSTTAPPGAEPRKRRRHQLMQETIRKCIKKRAENAAKNGVRKPAVMHDTHNAFNKMAKLGPQELSRMKAEKELRETAEVHAHRQRQQAEYLARQQAQATAGQSQQPQQAATATAPNGQRVPTQTQVVPAVSAASAAAAVVAQAPVQANVPLRPAGNSPAAQTPTQNGTLARPQVNISQQQRFGTPIINGANRLSPQQQQILQAQRAAQLQQGQFTQAQLSQALAQAQAQNAAAAAAAQQQQQQGVPVVNGTTSGVVNGAVYTREATSSPAHAQTSPPRTTSTPSNATPRPTSAQAQTGANGIPRAVNMNGHYYLTNPSFNSYTPEQLNTFRILVSQTEQVRAHAIVQQMQHQHQQQQQQPPSANNGTTNATYPATQ